MHFRPEEFRCRCKRPECDAPVGPSVRLGAMLDKARDAYGESITVTSGNRCAFWNVKQGGVPGSEHVRVGGCEGADLACPDSWRRWRLVDALRVAGFVRIGIGKDFVHAGAGLSEADARPRIWTYYA